MKNSELLALLDADAALLERVREDLLFEGLAEDVRGAGLQFTGLVPKADAAASGLDAESELPRVLVRLSAYIPRQPGADGQPAYAVFHKSFADWLADPERAGQLHQVSAREGHRRLAEVCWQQYEQGIAQMSPYALTHLIPRLRRSDVPIGRRLHRHCGRAAR